MASLFELIILYFKCFQYCSLVIVFIHLYFSLFIMESYSIDWLSINCEGFSTIPITLLKCIIPSLIKIYATIYISEWFHHNFQDDSFFLQGRSKIVLNIIAKNVNNSPCTYWEYRIMKQVQSPKHLLAT